MSVRCRCRPNGTAGRRRGALRADAHEPKGIRRPVAHLPLAKAGGAVLAAGGAVVLERQLGGARAKGKRAEGVPPAAAHVLVDVQQ